jgi:alkanesulfonate monooxygenase SsuD/methylene tetrahydromethanopterin reductase-like flavin-dependent oxidoreductase (luciferase family)
MRPMMIGVGLDARLGLSFGQLREMAQEASRLGFESLWTPAGGVPDAFHVCAAWSRDTGLRTGISVVPAALMWTPSSLAVQAATVGQLSSGRFVLGLGTGGVGPAFWAASGLPDRPIAVMRKYATAVRDLLAGQTVSSDGLALGPRITALRASGLAQVPVYLAALGPQMLRLAGEVADGALLNWATADRIAISRDLVAAGIGLAGRNPDSVPLTMYVRVCVDDDVAAARLALGGQVLSYAMTPPGTPKTAGYRGMFGQMGFDAVLTELEHRRDRGTPLPDLVDAAPDELLQAVGYYGPASGAPSAYARLSTGLDETVVRVVTVRPGPEPVLATMSALTPTAIRAA